MSGFKVTLKKPVGKVKVEAVGLHTHGVLGWERLPGQEMLHFEQ